MNISVEDFFMVIMAFLFGLFLRKEMACGLVEGNSAEVLERCLELDPGASYQSPESKPRTVNEYNNICDDGICPTQCEKIRKNFCDKKVTPLTDSKKDILDIIYDTCGDAHGAYGDNLSPFETMCKKECLQFYNDNEAMITDPHAPW
jgi:hypothetical protein